MELHSKEILVLNLKPSNMLLTTKDQAILGDVGIPFLLHGVPMPNTDIVQRLGTPNYMAPEQWQPEVRGPISYETDSWGFACCMIEMLTGVQPWRGKSVDEIFHSVVRKQEKPCIPSGLPPIIENVLLGCFEYDLRSRPLVTDILNVFQRYVISFKSALFSHHIFFLLKRKLNFSLKKNEKRLAQRYNSPRERSETK